MRTDKINIKAIRSITEFFPVTKKKEYGIW